MNKHHLSLLAFVTLLCVMLLDAVSCKKDNVGDGETPNPTETDFFIDVDFLPETETNGAAAPRLMINFNDEAVMIELRRPSASTPMESVLFLYPDNEAMMMCGNDSLMVCAEYDLEAMTPSDNVLLVTQMDDNALLLTKCVMDWNTNTMTKGDKMVLPIDGTSKKQAGKGGDDDDMRWFFFNHFIKPLTEKLDQFESFCGIFPVPQGIVVSYIKTIISTAAPIMLFSDDPEAFIDAMEYPITSYTESAVQTGLLHFVPQDMSDMASRILAGIGWFTSGGHSTVNEYEESGETNNLPFSTYFTQSFNATSAASQITDLDPIFTVKLFVFDVTENSARLSGSLQNINTNTSPVEMGYIYKVSGGVEHSVEDMGFHGKTISSLQKATKYTAYAYAKSIMGDMVLSPAVTFMTLGFEAFPTSLTFPPEGDTKHVGLSYSEEDITGWSITSKPSWCTVNKVDDRMFTIKVDASTETRSGTIVVTGNSQTLGNVTENIAVTQSSSNGWDGTYWEFNGMLTHNDTHGNSISLEKLGNLRVYSVLNNDIFSTFALAIIYSSSSYNENYVINGNGNLIYTVTANNNSGWDTCQITFVRTGSTTATADCYYQSFHDFGELGWQGYTETGLLQGILMPSKIGQ